MPMWMESKHMQGTNIIEMDISLHWFITRYETEGLNFFAAKKEHRKGPNNIVDLWRDLNIGECLSCMSMTINISLSAETTEEADSHKVLKFGGKWYPQLPGNVVELQL